MRRVSLSDLSQLTTSDSRTVKAALEEAGIKPLAQEGRSIIYASDAALQAIYAPERGGVSHLSPTDKLAHARWELANLDLQVKRGELLDRATVLKHWTALIAAFRTRMLALPTRLAPQIAPPGKAQKTEDLIAAAVHEALAEVASDGLQQP